MRQIIYALILLLILIYRPRGFWGKVELEWPLSRGLSSSEPEVRPRWTKKKYEFRK
jgi:hypothetical protein